MQSAIKHIAKLAALLLVLLILFFTEIRLLVNKRNFKQTLISNTISIVREKEFEFLKLSNTFFSDSNNVNENYLVAIQRANKNNIGLCAFKNDSLFLWNNNLLNAQKYKTLMRPGTRFLLANNGFYLVHFFKYGSYSLVLYNLIKTNYQYQNQYIKNYFSSEYAFLGSAIPSPSPIDGFDDITDSKGNFLFSIKVYDDEGYTPYWLIALIVVCVCSIIIYFHFALQQFINYNFIAGTIVFFLLLLLAKYVLLKFKLPVFIYKLELFNASVYGSSTFIPSLGDFIITVFIVLWYFFLIDNIKLHVSKNYFNNFIKLFFTVIVCITLIDSSFDGLKSLVIDSQIVFDTNNIYSLNYLSFAAMILSIMLIAIMYFVCKRFYHVYAVVNISNIQKLIFSSFTVLYIHPFIVKFLFERQTFYPFINIVVLLLFTFYFDYAVKKLNKLQQYIALSLAFAAFAGITIQYWNNEKEKEKRELFADKLIAQNDINTEDFLRQIETKILNDKEVKRYFSNPIALQTQLQRRLRQLYFTGYLSRYDITLFDYDSSFNFYRERNPYTYRQLNYAYKELSNETISKNFKLLKNTAFIKGYLGKFNIYKNNLLTGYLFIQLSPKLLADENRFDELLIEGFRSTGRKKHIDYSYAIYRDNRLQTHSGLYNYHIENKWKNIEPKYSYAFENDYEHLIKKDGFNGMVVVSKKLNPAIEHLGLFSLYFTIFSILLLALLITTYLVTIIKKYHFNFLKNKFHHLQIIPNFINRFANNDVLLLRSKIQITLVLIVFFTLLITAFFTINLVSKSYADKQTDKLVKKLRSVVSALDSDVLADKLSNKIEIDAYLNQIGDYYDTDITYFDINGQVVGSTISKIYENGIIAPLIDANAYLSLRNENQSRFINNEYIANFDFVGAYLTLVNKSKDVSGYIMLPYFNSREELYAELSGIIMGFINLYAFLFIVIGIIAWIIGRSISNPLAIIQKQFAKISLTQKNQPLVWHNNDEIGRLVEEYNKMIDALEKSAEILAQSERESTWRDIARQIAHEIKNPLTPMKLSVQHLERAWNDKHPKLPETFKKVTNTLINQIDILSELAAEFSNYAKMPVAKISKVNLYRILLHQTELYKNVFSGTIILSEPNFDTDINFDESFLNRTFSNLIKNAIQATSDQREGIINITITKQENGILVSVSDNGIGIELEIAEKVFTPYYSTKSFGMGLGLPIVKNMIESCGGKIWFQSEVGIGTTFFILLPFNNA